MTPIPVFRTPFPVSRLPIPEKPAQTKEQKELNSSTASEPSTLTPSAPSKKPRFLIVIRADELKPKAVSERRESSNEASGVGATDPQGMQGANFFADAENSDKWAVADYLAAEEYSDGSCIARLGTAGCQPVLKLGKLLLLPNLVQAEVQRPEDPGGRSQ
jgi:hypothetical protein